MIHVVAVITTKPGQRDAVLAAFRENVPAVRAEDGCIEYGAAVDAEGMGRWQARVGANTFVVIEKWASAEALAAHAAAPHMAAYGARTKDLAASRTIHVLSPARSLGELRRPIPARSPSTCPLAWASFTRSATPRVG